MRARRQAAGRALMAGVPAWLALAVGATGAPGGSSGPFNFDNYTNGAATLVVPPKSNVVMNFVNDGATPH